MAVRASQMVAPDVVRTFRSPDTAGLKGEEIAPALQRSFTVSSGQFPSRLELAGGSVRQLSRIQVDVDFPAVQVPTDELLGERILDVTLNGAAQRARPVRAVLARDFDNPVHHFRRERDPQLAIDEVLVELRDQQRHDQPQVVVGQRLEDDDLVDAVDELGVERPFDFAEHHLVHALRNLAAVGGLESHRALLLNEAGADVRRHDDDGVLEVHPVAEVVGEVAALEHLQQDIEDVRMRLLDLVEQHHRVRVAFHLLGELAALFVTDVSGRRADQLRDRVLLHVLGHVEADQRMVAAEEEIRERARQLGLADAGGPEEYEAADGPVRILQPGARAPDRARDRRDRLLLADDAPVQLDFHPQQLVAFVLVDRRHRHAGPLRDDLVDLGLADNDLASRRLDVELLADELQVLARRHFLLAVELRLFEILLADRALHLLDGDADALVDLAEFLAVAGLAQLGARARLVDEVDRLVGQEAVGDVAVRLVDGRLDRLARVLHVMEALVAILDAEQDGDRLALARGVHLDGLKAPLERAVLLDVLPVLGRRRGADAADLAA